MLDLSKHFTHFNTRIGQNIYFDTLKVSLKLREKAGMYIDSKINQGIIKIEEGDTDFLRWHKNCYASFTSRKNIKTVSKTERQQSPQDVSEPKSSSLRKKAFDLKICVFCQKRSNVMKLSQVLTTNIEEKIKIFASENQTLSQRIGSNDLIAMEIKYHPPCFVASWSKLKRSRISDSLSSTTKTSPMIGEARIRVFEKLQKGFEEGKGYSLSSVYNRYLDLGGQISKRHLIKTLNKHFGDKIRENPFVQRGKTNLSLLFLLQFLKIRTFVLIWRVFQLKTRHSRLVVFRSILSFTKLLMTLKMKWIKFLHSSQ